MKTLLNIIGMGLLVFGILAFLELFCLALNPLYD